MSDTWVLIPNQNGMRWLPDCLGTLEASLRQCPAEVLVVDNNSHDESQQFIRQRFPHFSLLPLEMNLGFVHAMNLAILTARGAGAKRVVLLNNDTRLSDNWLSELIAFSEGNSEFGILGSMQKDFDDNLSPRTQAVVKSWYARDGRTEAGDKRDGEPSIPDCSWIPTDWVEGSCMLIQDWVFQKIGYLDPLFAPAYFEEVDFCRRAQAVGIPIGLVTGSTIWHFGAGASTNTQSRSRQRVLSERNYQLYHAGAPANGTVRSLYGLLTRSIRHGGKQVLEGKLGLGEWMAALKGIPARLPAVHAKTKRDFARRPCPIMGDRIPDSLEQRYAARCVEQIISTKQWVAGHESAKANAVGACVASVAR